MKNIGIISLILTLGVFLTPLITAAEEESHSSGLHNETHDDHESREAHDAHEERDSHEEHEENEEHGEHGDGENGGHEPHGEHEMGERDDHGDEGVVTLTAEGRKMADIQLSKVEKQRISRKLELPGEVGFNEDNLAHVTPRYGGIVQEVRARLGQYVRQGEVLAVIENNETLSRYSVKAPINGLIIEKHVTRGEYVSEESSIYVTANLATVWINLDVYPRYLDKISTGSMAAIKALGIEAGDTGKVSYITPVFDPQKRSATARVVLRNRNNKWRPGTFVTASITVQSEADMPAVVSEAVQVLDGEKCIFVPAGKGFKPLPVKIGAQGAEYTEIVEGIKLDQAYVSNGAFELKAAIVTSSLGGHAGHGH